MIEEGSEHSKMKSIFPPKTSKVSLSLSVTLVILIYVVLPAVHLSLLPPSHHYQCMESRSLPLGSSSPFYIPFPSNPAFSSANPVSFRPVPSPMEARGRSRRRNLDGCTVVECYTPRRVVARWLFGLRSAKGKREEEEEEEEEEVTGPIMCSTKRINEGIPLSPAPTNDRFESHSREASMELGISSFLLYLVVASKTELDKMAKLRMQMEMLLQNFKEEIGKKEFHGRVSPQVISNLASSIFEESSSSVLQNECTEWEVSKPEEFIGGTDLEPKLEPNLNKAGERVHRQLKVKDIESTKSNMLKSEEITNERYGVCPYELERRLHELQASRQQEEIQELETALRRVERRLDDKETEVSWWKDAASLLVHRVPESSRVGLESCIPELSRTQPERSVPESTKTVLKRRVSWSR